LTIPVGAEKDEVLAMAKADEKVQDSIQGKNVLKEIYVPNKLVNFVAK
jgi:leucyl-tRNA synthetase